MADGHSLSSHMGKKRHLFGNLAHGLVEEKHRSLVIFDDAQPNIASLLNTIKAEASLWGTTGVSALLPVGPSF
jgi:hypothetical protein